MNSPNEQYFINRSEQIAKNKHDRQLKQDVRTITDSLIRTNYIKNFSWLGRPIMQYPTDMITMQELIWRIKPDFIIETGIAFGGSIIFYASILEMIGGLGRVIAIDNDIREHNYTAIDEHQMRKRIHLIEGSSIASWVAEEVREITRCSSMTMVVLDSNHSEKHVLKELELYTPLVHVDSYCIVCDTAIEYWADKYPFPERPWGIGNNPATAVKKFLKGNDSFLPDLDIESQTVITGHPGGWLRKVR